MEPLAKSSSCNQPQIHHLEHYKDLPEAIKNIINKITSSTEEDYIQEKTIENGFFCIENNLSESSFPKQIKHMKKTNLIKADFYTEISKNFSKNRKDFLLEVISNIKNDLQTIGQTFLFEPEEVIGISIKSSSGDFHKKGKNPLFITFKLDKNRETTVVYKPRNLEPDATLNRELSKVSVPKRNILVRNDSHGYDQWLGNSKTLKDLFCSTEESKDKNKPIKEGDEEEKAAEEYQKSKAKALLEKKTFLLFFEKRKLGELTIDESTIEKLNIDKSTIEKLTIEKLNNDIKLFQTLKSLDIEDIHIDNFILDSEKNLHCVDAECFGTKTSVSAEFALNLVKNIAGNEENDLDKNEALSEIASRILFLSTQGYLSAFSCYVEGSDLSRQAEEHLDYLDPLIENNETIKHNLKDTSDLIELFKEEMETCFSQGDIPSFTLNLKRGQILCDTTGKKLTKG